MTCDTGARRAALNKVFGREPETRTSWRSYVCPLYAGKCNGINSRLPLVFNAASASNALQVGVSLWAMGAWPLH
jgi:hypothetical protein